MWRYHKRPGPVSRPSRERYRVTQLDGTKRPFANSYWNNKEPGIYVDVVSREPLFVSTKIEGSHGWLRFTNSIKPQSVVAPMKRLVPAILAAWAVLTVAAHAGGDPARGKQVFKECAFCHAIGPHAMTKIGPPLNGVVGRVWGSWPHYSYSAGLVAGHNAGKVWDDAMLDRWLTAPQKMVPGTKMALDGLDPQQRADVIAFLEEFNKDGSQR